MTRVLVACEESQAVTIALRKRGIVAYSNDIQPPSGGRPEWHIQRPLQDIISDGWSAIIAFPPCTHLSSSGAAWWAEKRADGRQQAAVDFFMMIARADCPMIAIENPVGYMSTAWRKPDQIIHPWEFGHDEEKTTCLWLKNLPRLVPTNIVEGERVNKLHRLPPSPDRGKLRSKTFPGIAAAMADQWGDHIKRYCKSGERAMLPAGVQMALI